MTSGIGVDFLNITESSSFNVVKHNETDYDAYRRHQAKLEARHRKLEEDRTQNEIKANLDKWDAVHDGRWSGAELSRIDNPAAVKASELIAKHDFASMFVHGEPGSGKSYLSLAIARRFIAKGLIRPSQVKIISEASLLNLSSFNSGDNTERLGQLLKPQYRLYIFDNVGAKNHYTDYGQSVWEQVMDHIYMEDLAAVFASTGSPKMFSEKLTDPAASKFTHLVDGRIIHMKGKYRAGGETLGDLTRAEKITDDNNSVYNTGIFNS